MGLFKDNLFWEEWKIKSSIASKIDKYVLDYWNEDLDDFDILIINRNSEKWYWSKYHDTYHWFIDTFQVPQLNDLYKHLENREGIIYWDTRNLLIFLVDWKI